MDLIELQNKIHEQNKAMGWWDEPRPFSTFVCLFHSELSEAMEGDRKGLMDDHLPQYEMFWVELADFVIRCLDWLGSQQHKTSYTPNDYEVDEDKIESIALLHSVVSEAFECFSDEFAAKRIEYAVELSLKLAAGYEVDLKKIIIEKVEYNKNRADHQRENRAKDGGKKY